MNARLKRLEVRKGKGTRETIYLTLKNGVYYDEGGEVSPEEVERLESDKSKFLIIIDRELDNEPEPE